MLLSTRLFFVLLLFFSGNRSVFASEYWTATELAEGVLVQRDALKSVSMNVQTKIQFPGAVQREQDVVGEVYTFTNQRDGDRVNFTWSRQNISRDERVGDPVYEKRALWDGERYFLRQQSTSGSEGKSVYATTSEQVEQGQRLQGSYGLAPFIEGKLPGDQPKLQDWIAEADAIELGEELVLVDGHDTVHLSGTWEGRAFELWLDPQHGFNLRKAVIQIDRSVKIDGDSNAIRVVSEKFTIEDVQIDQIGDQWIPVAGKMTEVLSMSDGRQEETIYTTQRSDIQLNPDFDALGAFVMDGLEEDHKVSNNDFPQLPMRWREGRLVPDTFREID